MITNSWYYDSYDNMLIDQEGRPVIDILFKIMSPSRLLWCKQKRGTFYFKSKTEVDVTYEVVFPLESEEEDGYYYSCGVDKNEDSSTYDVKVTDHYHSHVERTY